jgi:hypothetical protein
LQYIDNVSVIILQRDIELFVTVELADGSQMNIATQDCDPNRVLFRYALKGLNKPISFLKSVATI